MTSYENDAFSPAPPSFGDGLTGGASEACYFNGTTQHLEIPHAPQIDFSTQDEFAISLWLKMPVRQIDIEGVVNDIISKWYSDDSEPYPFALRYYNHTSNQDGKLWLGRYETNIGTCGIHTQDFSKKKVNTDEWHHVVFQKRDGNIELHIDASTQVSIEDATTCSVENTTNIILARRTTNPIIDAKRRYHGAIDELRIYDRALANNEIILLSDNQSSVTNTIDITTWSVYPNPLKSGENLNIEAHSGEKIVALRLYSTHGLFIEDFRSNSITLNVPPGVYLLEVMDRNRKHIQPIVVYR